MRCIDGINEDSGDEKSGEHEEYVHAGPAPLQVRGRGGGEIMLAKDEQNGEGSEAIECRVEGSIGRLEKLFRHWKSVVCLKMGL